MKKYSPVSDREVYPALWLALLVMGGLYLLWRFAWGQPTVAACWFYSRWHVYCPGCGGTRAVIALLRGELLKSLYYHPAVPFAAISVFLYLLSQTIWRLRGGQGWTLHYTNRWFRCLLAIILLNCVLRNLLWFGFHIPL